MDVIEIAKDTLEAVKEGLYTNPAGEQVAIHDLVHACTSNTTYHEPDELDLIAGRVLSTVPYDTDATVAFLEETTLASAHALVTSGKFKRVGALNFASALSAGGRFLAGARAQEESLARSSALFESLVTCPQFYRFHHEQDEATYSDRMIYSPDCPVLKDDGGRYLSEPYCVDFLTSAAPYAGFANLRDPVVAEGFQKIFMERGRKVLALFADKGCDALVLGAWGCGAFLNDPEMVAGMFSNYLGPDGAFTRHFKHIRFSVHADPDDRERRNYHALREAFQTRLNVEE